MDDLEILLRGGDGVLVGGGDRVRARRLQRLAQRGLLVPVAPGIYLPNGRETDVLLRIVAASHWAPNGIITGAAAARLTFWPEVTVDVITLTGPVARTGVPGFRLRREQLPRTLVGAAPAPFQLLTTTVPALTAIDLGADGIDRALLRGAASLSDMHRALELTPNRPGNVARRTLLHDSRDEPWSAAERLSHAILRSSGITGWRSNAPVRCPAARYYVDIAWPRLKLAIEIDGYAYHSDRAQFERDRRKWSDLTAEGWRIIHLTWTQLTDDAEWVVRTVRATMSQI